MENKSEVRQKDLEKVRENLVKEKKRLILPGNGKLISEFALEIAEEIRDKNCIFYRDGSNDIIEIGDIKENENNDEYVGFLQVKGDRFVTLAERFIIPIKETHNRFGSSEIPKSMDASMARTILMANQLQDNINKIKRIFTVPIPIIYKGELTFPISGYDKRFCSWMPTGSPKINDNMTLEEAMEIIKNIFQEFCFQKKEDFTNAVAALLTPFLRGLFPKFSTRTPLFFYIANRERAGKDYCANITGIVYEGHSLEEPPISSGEKSGNNNEELRKKILSAMIAGRKRMHFANNKGYINNAVLEGVLTSEKHSDRALGRNETLIFDNEIDFSLSGNVGIGFTADLANRARFIRLFLDLEDANTRQFKNPNLHLWVKENRSKILSALFTLIRNWFDSGKKDGSVPFSSFPEWAKVCGGIMEAAGYNNPCKPDVETFSVGGDSETQDMKILFEMCYEQFGEKFVKAGNIKSVIMESDDPMFSYLDFDRKSDQTKFGNKIVKFTGRVLSGIKLSVKDNNVRSSRREYIFTKVIKTDDKSEIFESGNHGNIGNPRVIAPYARKIHMGIGKRCHMLPGCHPLTHKELENAGYSPQEASKIEELANQIKPNNSGEK